MRRAGYKREVEEWRASTTNPGAKQSTEGSSQPGEWSSRLLHGVAKDSANAMYTGHGHLHDHQLKTAGRSLEEIGDAEKFVCLLTGNRNYWFGARDIGIPVNHFYRGCVLFDAVRQRFEGHSAASIAFV